MEIELNGQENFRTGAQVQLVEVSPLSLRLRGHGVHSGYVDAPESRKVREIAVRFTLAPRNFEYLRALVDIGRHDGCHVRVRRRARSIQPKRFTPVVVVRP